MKHILKFKEFESRVSDILIAEGSGEIYDYVINYAKLSFDYSGKLKKYFTLNRQNNKDRIEIEWNHSSNHNLFNRINNRTSLKSINEFNILFEKVLNKSYNFIKNIKRNDYYGLYVEEYNFTIIIYINVKNKLFIRVNTILPGFMNNKVADFYSVNLNN